MSEPEWWTRAQELERQDRLEEAEKVIHDALHPNYPWPASYAEMYRRRLVRLLDEGRLEAAAAARERAVEWIWANARCATSGGEGAALSQQAREFERSLPKVPGRAGE